MSTLLLNLRGVPDDEANEVRELLDSHGLAYFETPPNRWGITAGAIWLSEDERADEAAELLAHYQHERRERMRAEHERQREEGTAETVVDKFRDRPLASLVYLLIIAGLIYFTIRPFFGLAG